MQDKSVNRKFIFTRNKVNSLIQNPPKGMHTEDGRTLWVGSRRVVPLDEVTGELQRLFDNPETRILGRDRFYMYISEKFVGISRRAVAKFLQKQEAYQLHRLPSKKKIVRKPITTKKPGSLVQVDLMDVSSVAKYNHG